MNKGKSIEIKTTKEEMIDIQMQRGKRLYDILFPSERPEEEIVAEYYEEALSLKPSLEKRLAKGDRKITLDLHP